MPRARCSSVTGWRASNHWVRSISLALSGEQRRALGNVAEGCDGGRKLVGGHGSSVGPRRPDVDGVEESVDLVELVTVEGFEAVARR